MFTISSSFDYMASSSSSTPADPEQDTLVSSKGKAEADETIERSNEEAGFLGTVLPRAAFNNQNACALKIYRGRPGSMSSYSVSARKQVDTEREAFNEAAESTSAVRVAETVKDENSDGRDEAEGQAWQGVGDREDDKGRGEEVDKLDARPYGENGHRKGKGRAGEVAAQGIVKSRKAPALQESNAHAVGGHTLRRPIDGFLSPSNSYVPSTERRIESQCNVVEGTDSLSKGEIGSVKAPTVSAARTPVADYVAEVDNKSIRLGEAEQVVKDGAAVFVHRGKLRVRAGAAETVVETKVSSKGEGVQQLKSITLPAPRYRHAGAGEPKPSQTTATDADEQWTSSGFRAVVRNTTARSSRSRAMLSSERGSDADSFKYEAFHSQEKAGKSQKEDCALAAGTRTERNRVCEEHFVVVAAGEKSGSSLRKFSHKSQSESVPVSTGNLGLSDGEQKLTTPATAMKFNGTEDSVVCARLSTRVEQSTSLSAEERRRSLVSSRRQIFEHRAPGVSDRQSPLIPLPFKQRDPAQIKGVQVEKGTTTPAAGPGDRWREAMCREGTLVEKLKEKYEGGRSGSRRGSLQTQLPAGNRALSTTSIRVEASTAEPAWRRRQREKLEAAQAASGQSSVESTGKGGGDHQDDFTSSGASDVTIERRDFANSANVGDVAEKSPFPAGTAVTSEPDSAPETRQSTTSRKNAGHQMHRIVVKVNNGECSTVTSLKERFERRKTSSNEERQQQAQEPQNCMQQHQQQQPLRHAAESVKRLKAQYEQGRRVEENKPLLRCQGVITTASTSVTAEKSTRLPKPKEQLRDFSVGHEQRDSGTASPLAGSPSRCSKEHYQRLVTATAAEQRAGESTTIGGSTTVESARKLLSSVDIAGRYGKPYWTAKAEGALKKDGSPTNAEELSEWKRPDNISAIAEPATIAASTTVESTRKLLGSIDIAGRYGKPYWTAKAEGALKKHESPTNAEEVPVIDWKRDGNISVVAVAPVTTLIREDAHRASSGDVSLVRSRSRDASNAYHSGERTSSRRRASVATGDEVLSKESRASGEATTLETESAQALVDDASPLWKREVSADAALKESQPRIGDCRAAGRSAGKVLCVEMRESAAGTCAESVYLEEEKSPTVRAHVSSKIGALASAIGPACINFGKAPPRRLLTRAEPEAEMEETDPEIYGYTKAQEAIQRRKDELKLSAKVTDCGSKKQGDTCCADTTEKNSSIPSGTGRSTGDRKDPMCSRNSAEDEDICVFKNDENTVNDKGVGNNSVTESNSSRRKSSGEVAQSSGCCAETEKVSSSVGRMSNINGAKVQLSLSSDDSSDTKRMLSTYVIEEVYGSSDQTGCGDALSKCFATQEKNPGCRTSIAVDSNTQDSDDIHNYRNAPNAPTDHQAHPSGSRVGFGRGRTSVISCSSSLKRSYSREKALLSRETNIRYHHRVPLDGRDESDGASAEAAEGRREAESGRCKADSAAPVEMSQTYTGANEQSFRRVKNGPIQACGEETVSARDEAQLSQVQDLLKTEEQTTAKADVLGEKDPANSTRKEQLHTSKNGLDDATEKESLHVFTFSRIGTTHAFRSAANVKEETDVDSINEQKEPVAEACVTYK